MLSKRFFFLFSTVVKAGNYFGSFAFTFDPLQMKASLSSNSNLQNKIYINHILCLLAILNCFIVITKEYIYGNINDLLYKILFTFVIFMMLLIYFIAQYYLDDLILFTNAAFGLYRHIHGKKNKFRDV